MMETGSELTGFLGERRTKKKARRCCFLSFCVAVCVVAIFIVVVGVSAGVAAIANGLPSDPDERAVALLNRYPLIDGLVVRHNESHMYTYA